MKKYFIGLFAILTLAACKHSAKDPDLAVVTQDTSSKDDVTKETISDRHGDEMEIITNNTKNIITVHLNGKTYELKKNQTTTGFSTEDNKYLYTETQNEVTFLKKEMDMVLFHGKRNQADSKMASQ
ncbi:hypothetical protein CHRY9390_00690 [Chryseobacterium aquaeductus]|uniref:Copper resistance protein NlpE n=1 Tax=Chryseobacterium aquaeductus TaxID=2675056 RepID=A0A9N8QR64_9FLAO|nr:hypothetical protein [Chryseobacterium aquaeductus]CAA7330040.1 hypothetical protein CHRY9390_00690 [Chryseobacterium potabilaquae]CAD7800852.1 hypothetical protein CHRY9390_00690 [Chryseobacterium aquaeductus]